MKAIKVRVTRAMIRAGEPYRPVACPVALAVCKATGSSHANVGLSIAWGWMGCKWTHVSERPASVRDFVKRFDAGKPVKPFTFMLRTDSPP